MTSSRPPPVPPEPLDVALLRGAVEEIPFGIATTRGDEILYANAALERIFGAKPGELDGRPLGDLFDETTFASISASLRRGRVFDGRVAARAIDGSEITCEMHVERYTSEAGATGGFVVLRDVTFEAGALARLLDLLGAALFRMRVDDGALESVSPAVEGLVGVPQRVCLEQPATLLTLVSPGELERLQGVYRRIARGETTTALTDVAIRRPDGSTAVLKLRMTGRRDLAGAVRHVDGILSEAHAGPIARIESSAPPADGEVAAVPDETAAAVLSLSRNLLREATRLMGGAGNSMASIRTLVEASSVMMLSSVPQGLLLDIDTVSTSIAAATAITRRVRRALDGRVSQGALVDVLENVRGTLAPLIGTHAVTVNVNNGARAMIAARLDELTLALTHLALRAFRLARSGAVRLDARRTEAAPSGRPDAYLVIEVVGEASAENAMAGADVTASNAELDVLRQADLDRAFRAASAVLAAIGGEVESDEPSPGLVRTVVRLPPAIER